MINLLISRSKRNSFVLFIDRDEKIVRDSITNIIEKSSLLSSIQTFQERGSLEDTPSELGEWYINIPSLPRQKWLSFFSLAQKTPVN